MPGLGTGIRSLISSPKTKQNLPLLSATFSGPGGLLFTCPMYVNVCNCDYNDVAVCLAAKKKRQQKIKCRLDCRIMYVMCYLIPIFGLKYFFFHPDIINTRSTCSLGMQKTFHQIIL